MKAQKKTNVLRLLDQAHIAYEAFEAWSNLQAG